MTYKEWISEENLLKLGAWARDGLTDKDIAKNIGIAPSTFNEWKYKYPELLDIIKKNKEVADIIIENALYKRAKGYDTIEEQIEYAIIEGKRVEVKSKKVIKHIPPDTTAQIFWLKNRKPEVWREKSVDTYEAERTQQTLDNLKDFEIKFVDGGADENDKKD